MVVIVAICILIINIHYGVCAEYLFVLRYQKGRTALFLAAEKGHYTIVEFFVENGADIEAVDHVTLLTFHLNYIELP